MEKDHIKSIEVDSEGRLHIIPEKLTFPMIYRTAAGINWNPDKHSLYSQKLREWTYLMWYNHILNVVQEECSCKLELFGRTTWTNVPNDLIRKIENNR